MVIYASGDAIGGAHVVAERTRSTGGVNVAPVVGTVVAVVVVGVVVVGIVIATTNPRITASQHRRLLYLRKIRRWLS